jgi:hypothetical protein
MKQQDYSLADAESIFTRYHTPPNIRLHGKRVADVCAFIGREFEDQVDMNMLVFGAVIHDFQKMVGKLQIELKYFKEPPSYQDMDTWREQTIKHQGLDHANAASNELMELGYPEKLAILVFKHDYSRIDDPDLAPRTLEEKILFYADKRVLHHGVVSLDERFVDGEKRYPETTKRVGYEIKKAATYELEREIFESISINESDIIEGSIEKDLFTHYLV